MADIKPLRRMSVAVLLAFFFLSACHPVTDNLPDALPNWQIAALRALDPVDALLPTQDLVALSLRHLQGQVQVRLDWLDIEPESACDVQLDFFSSVNDNHPPVLSISLSVDGSVHTSQHLYGLRIYRDVFYDTLIFSFGDEIHWLHAIYYIRAQSKLPGTAIVTDVIGPVRSNALPPPSVPVLLAFWNTFPAVTPAQALRQWDGAHSGPLRDRHGLRYLLEAAAETHTPLFLLDAKTPAALSALDAVGGIESLQGLAVRNLVILPDAAPAGINVPAWASQQMLAESRHSGLDFGLAASSFGYIPLWTNKPAGYAAWFTFEANANPADISVPTRCQGARYLPLANSPTPFSPQATRDGPSLSTRQKLANAYLSYGYTHLGGDFAADTWGMPQPALATLRYLAARPWLKPLDAYGLHQLITKNECPQAAHNPPDAIYETVFVEITRTPDNAFKAAAWQMIQAIMTPAPVQLAELRAEYAGQTGHLLAAARWASQPQGISDCSQDLDWDGETECVLASDSFFAILERKGGYVSIAAAIVDGEIHQVIAPSWQFVIGISDPMDWQPILGIAGDPLAQPGAFFDPADRWRPYVAEANPGEVILSDVNGSKVFRVVEDRLIVTYGGDAGLQQVIGLGLDAWGRFQPGWMDGYYEDISSQDWVWGIAHGPQIWLEVGDASLKSETFSATLPFLHAPEDPNLAYPAGHFLPFPFAVITVEGATEIIVGVR